MRLVGHILGLAWALVVGAVVLLVLFVLFGWRGIDY